MRKPRLLPTIWTSIRVMLATAKTSITCIVMSRLTGNKQYTMEASRKDWGPNLFRIAGASLNVIDTGAVDYTRPHIFVMNHQSHLDIPAAFQALPVNIGFIAKKELERIPLFGRVMRECGMIFVDRSNPERAIESLKKGGQLIRDGVNIFAFPEGTRSKNGYVQPFKKGVFMLALEAGVPIVPMAIHGARDALPYGSFDPIPNEITVKIGSPIALDEYDVSRRDDLINDVRKAVIELNLELGGMGAQP